MVFNRFRRIIVYRLIAFSLSLLMATYLAVFTAFYITAGLVFILVFVQVLGLIRYLDVAHERLARFFHAVQHADFTQVFRVGNEDDQLNKLNHSLNDVMEKFRQIRSVSEEREFFFQTVMHHIGTGLFVISESDEVSMMNSSARRMLRLGHVKHLSEFQGVSLLLVQKLRDRKSEQEFLLRLSHPHEVIQLSVSISFCRIREELFSIVALHDIGKELDRKELESWQLLTRVLAHEIMNSMTPIISLAASATESIRERGESRISESSLEEVEAAIEAIGRRSEGLTRFVDTYRHLTRIPRPNFDQIKVKLWLPRVFEILKERIHQENVNFEIIIEPEEIYLIADPVLIEQVLINLAINALDVLKEHIDPRLLIRVYEDDKNRVCIDIQDNGRGISEEILEDIFVPFFTTKRGGSGIGLSLSRQIMQLHAGNISVHSTPGNTTFILRF